MVGAEVQAFQVFIKQAVGELQALAQTLYLTFMHRKANGQIAGEQEIIQTITVLFEGLNILCSKQAALGIQLTHITVENVARQSVVEANTVVVMAA